jgi:hypothetical protein
VNRAMPDESEQVTRDGRGRVRGHPGQRPTIGQLIFPRRMGNYYNFDKALGRSRKVTEIMDTLTIDSVDSAKASLDFVQAIAQSAKDRADAADRRATTVTSSAAIAASLTLSGASLLLDDSKWIDAQGLRVAFGVALCLTSAFFVFAALVAGNLGKDAGDHELAGSHQERARCEHPDRRGETMAGR